MWHSEFPPHSASAEVLEIENIALKTCKSDHTNYPII